MVYRSAVFTSNFWLLLLSFNCRGGGRIDSFVPAATHMLCSNTCNLHNHILTHGELVDSVIVHLDGKALLIYGYHLLDAKGFEVVYCPRAGIRSISRAREKGHC